MMPQKHSTTVDKEYAMLIGRLPAVHGRRDPNKLRKAALEAAIELIVEMGALQSAQALRDIAQHCSWRDQRSGPPAPVQLVE